MAERYFNREAGNIFTGCTVTVDRV